MECRKQKALVVQRNLNPYCLNTSEKEVSDGEKESRKQRGEWSAEQKARMKEISENEENCVLCVVCCVQVKREVKEQLRS